jgi:hypothetical protein
MRGRITMLGLSRWSEKGGSYRTITRFFNSTINWETINWIFIQTHLIKKGSVYLCKFADSLNVVIIQKINTKTGKMAHVNLFSSNLIPIAPAWECL